MSSSAPIFYDDVAMIITYALLLFSLIIEGVAFVHCLTQRADAFPAIGTLPKGAWLAILGLAIVLGALGVSPPPLGMIGLIGVAAAAIYLLDVRAGLRDLTDGKGFW
jgi:hypothetical protein